MKHIVITGASSGIGRALALHYAGSGTALSLIGRDQTRLDDVRELAITAGAVCESVSLDVSDTEALAACLSGIEARRPIDLLIVNAGILEGRKAGEACEDLTTARRVVAVNLTAALETLHAVLPAMQARGAGQIVLISSLAAFAPLADAPAYGASKAALLSYGLALREALDPSGIRINVVTPGYVTTGMTARHIGAHPFEIPAEDAARRIAAGIERNAAIIGFPTILYLASRFSQLLPDFMRRAGNAGLRFTVADDDRHR